MGQVGSRVPEGGGDVRDASDQDGRTATGQPERQRPTADTERPRNQRAKQRRRAVAGDDALEPAGPGRSGLGDTLRDLHEQRHPAAERDRERDRDPTAGAEDPGEATRMPVGHEALDQLLGRVDAQQRGGGQRPDAAQPDPSLLLRGADGRPQDESTEHQRRQGPGDRCGQREVAVPVHGHLAAVTEVQTEPQLVEHERGEEQERSEAQERRVANHHRESSARRPCRADRRRG